MDKINNTKCACCGFLTHKGDVISDICPICFWQTDSYQEEHIDDSGGPNLISLRQARENFKSFEAVEVRFINLVRPPEKDEIEG
ncbi:CPCC family cysteine-rich protein [Flavobacterium lindanitolerans]|uniref:CPCC family cysteine-rich protein n=1 Tax=Flavobacterium lindanitolerans TaxID=428988 RepID=UPI0027B9075B|nr:CPCC family cysteine-rich protein [Flavobacterium lindanitolerans]